MNPETIVLIVGAPLIISYMYGTYMKLKLENKRVLSEEVDRIHWEMESKIIQNFGLPIVENPPEMPKCKNVRQEIGEEVLRLLREEPFYWVLDEHLMTYSKNKKLSVWIATSSDYVTLYKTKDDCSSGFDDVFDDEYKKQIYTEYENIKYSRMMETADLRYILAEKIN